LANIAGISFVELDETDIVRHPLVIKIVKAYSKEREKAKESKTKDKTKE